MPKHVTEDRNGHLRTTLELQPGESAHLCRCWQSKEFPFCDGTHKQLPNDQGPVIVKQAQAEPAAPQK